MEYHAGDGMGSNRSALHVARDCMKSTAVTSNTIADCLKQAVGGRPGMQRKRAAAALSQTGRAGPDHAANTRRPAGRPHTPTGCTRQTSDRQHHRLMPPGWGHNNRGATGGPDLLVGSRPPASFLGNACMCNGIGRYIRPTANYLAHAELL